MVTGIGPIKVTEICQKLEDNGFVLSEKRSRSLIYTSKPKFARSFGFDNESRRLKLQMLWRLKRLMGDFEAEEPEDEEDVSPEKEEEEKESEIIQEGSSSVHLDKEETEDSIKDDQVLEDEDTASIITTTASTNGDNIDIEEEKSDTEEPEKLEIIQEGSSSPTLDKEIGIDIAEDDQVLEDAASIITTTVSTNGDSIYIEEEKSDTEEPEKIEDLSLEEKREEKESEIIQEDSSSPTLDKEIGTDFPQDDQVLEDATPIITTPVPTDENEDDKSDVVDDKLKIKPFEEVDTETQPPQIDDYDKTKLSEKSINVLENLGSISHSNDSDMDENIKEIKFGNHIEIIEEE